MSRSAVKPAHPHSRHAQLGPKPKVKELLPTLKRLAGYLARRKGLLFLVVLMVAASSALGLLGPYLVGRAIDDFIMTKDRQGLVLLLVLLAVVYVFYSATIFLQNYWMVGVAQKTVYEMRTELFTHLHQLPLSFFDKRQHGELMSRVTNDIENISSTLNSSVIQVASSVLTLTGAIAVMLYLSPVLTAVTLLIVPLLYIGMNWITSRTRRLFKEQQRHLGELNGFIEEAVSSKHIVKMFSREEKIALAFNERNAKLKEAGFWAQTYSGFIPKLMNMLNNISFALIAGAGGLLALYGHVTVGVIVVFAEYSRQFTRPLNDLANQFNTLLSAIAGAERVFDILDTEQEEKEKAADVQLDNVRGKIEFRDVSFAYEKGNETIKKVSFTAESGDMVALVGPTGSGKSTIINLLARFYDPDSGAILVDGCNTASIPRSELRKHMGFVLQDAFLFEGTIKENIRYGRLEATDEEVIAAAKSANAHSFIMKLPDGYETKLQNEGTGISQGQKQLLAIARAMLADPAILILDEATSSIDTITEMYIQEALSSLMKGRTTIIIAHRLNTIRQADQILVLNQGQIAERGTHDTLIQKQGQYAGYAQRLAPVAAEQ
ncbi:ABC transporter ATP-binding protein [Pseudobacillus badius]|uniref:ABC transporter ATP-binding protein n=1 Tax=Bacillus badius TaxID=1455 RepID=UPI0024A1C04E|nr:ABC transporter ATP-binding protein [Bacillus badius]MED0665155.1 ABC transporter ATP-binding protein [Bacillus badius]GLY12278.1 putative ABC transporter ATP-binding protein YfiC [Bacillus badius]